MVGYSVVLRGRSDESEFGVQPRACFGIDAVLIESVLVVAWFVGLVRLSTVVLRLGGPQHECGDEAGAGADYRGRA